MAQQDILPPLTEDDRMLSGLVYPLWLFLGPIVLYGSKKDEPYLHFNALQAIALGISTLIAGLLVFLLTWFLMWLLPGTYIALSAIMGIVIFTVIVLIILFYLTSILFIAWRVANGKFLRLPLIGQWAEKRMQRNLNLTPESYSTAIFGDKRSKVKLSNFDYRSVPGYTEEEELTEEAGADADEAYYNPDTGTYEYEYNPEEASPAALLSYEDANAPQTGAISSAAAARPSGFKARAPRAASQTADEQGFKPLSHQFDKKTPESDPAAPVVAGQRSSSGQFKPLAPQSAAVPAPAPVIAGQRQSSGQFKPLAPQTAASAPAPAPVIAGQRQPSGQFKPLAPQTAASVPAPAAAGPRSASGQFKPFNPQSYPPLSSSSSSEAGAPRQTSSQFKPLTPQSKPTSSLSGKSAPKFQWSKDFGQTGSDSGSSDSGISEPLSSADMGSGNFKPGLVSSGRPRTEAPRFQWDKLGDK